MRGGMICFWALGLTLLAGLSGCGRDDTAALVAEADVAIDRGGQYLLAQQDEDGLWRSETYGVFRDGASLSPHVLTVLMVVKPDDPGTRRGVAALASWVEGDGSIAPDLINPVYGAAEASWVMLMAQRPQQMAFVEMIRRHRLDESNGWSREDPQFGGWSDAPFVPTRPNDDAVAATRDANLSATLFAVGALKLGGVGPGDPLLQDAAAFTLQCRNADGGFFFSAVDPARNKAGPTGAAAPGRRFHSYGSATADAVRILLAAGRTPDDAHVAAARAWLVRHFDPASNPGTFNPDREVLRHSYDYYWAWSVSHAFDRLQHRTADWAPALARELIDRQNADGSWTNRFTDGKEDDPLVATPLALAALRICRDRMLEPVR